MLITVNKNFTIIIMKYTWYHRYKEIIQIGEPPLWLHWVPDLGRTVKCSDVTWAQSSHGHQLVFLVLLKVSSVIPLF